MQVAKGIFIFLWLIIILPLILLNLKKFRIKKEGEAPRANFLRIAIIAVLVVAVSLFALSLYNFTVNYQPQLALESQVSAVVEDIAAGSISSGPLYEAVSELGSPQDSFDIQASDKIVAKYAIGELPGADDLKLNDENTVYMAFRMAKRDDHGSFLLVLARMNFTDDKWQVEEYFRGDDEILSYLISKKLLYEVHVSPWRKL